MAIIYLPSKMLRSIAREARLKKLFTKNLTLNKAVLKSLASLTILSESQIEEIALRVIKQYKQTYKEERGEGASVAEAFNEATKDGALMISRVQNAIVFELSEKIKQQYDGQYYEWLPSDAKEPDPLHQLKYGKRFKVGQGEMPGDRHGCRCGMRILVEETKLEI